MKPAAKAALFSAIVFCVLAAVVLYLLPSGGGPGRVAEEEEESQAGGASRGAEDVVEEAPPPLEPVRRDEAQLTVEVLDAARKTRLRGSRVMVLRSQDASVAGRVEWESGSGGTGLFEISLLPGAYVVQVQCPRYKGERRVVNVQEGVPQTVVFELDRGNSIRGRVLTTKGDPIPGARVAALEDLAAPDASIEETLMNFIRIQEMVDVTTAETVSATDGSYQLDGLEPRHYTVRAVAAGFAPNQVESVPAPRDRVDIYLNEGGNVAGRVTDRAGRPIANAEVAAYPEVESQNVFDVIMAKARPPVDSAKTDERGEFRLQTLGAGVYNFLVKARGYQPGRFMKKRISAGLPELDFALDPGCILRGIVKGPNEEPIARATVRATPVGGTGGRQLEPKISFDEGSVKTDETGAFLLDDLEPGRYMVVCFHDLYETRQLKDVQPSLDGQEIEIRLGAGGRLKGKVIDSLTKAPVSGATVSVQDLGDLAKRDVTKEDGTFILGGLKAGPRAVSVSVVAKGYGRLRRDVTVRENAEVEEQFELVPAAVVLGTVVNSAGDPISGARVMARRGQPGNAIDYTLGADFTDAEGRFAVRDVEAGPNTWVEVKHRDYIEARSEAFEVASNDETELQPIVLRLGGAVAGRVRGPDGTPATGCSITILYEGDTELVRQGGGLTPSGATNSQGEFEVKGLRAGVVSVVVKPVRLLEKRIDGVRVDEGARTMLEVALEMGRVLAGRVVDGERNPVSGAEILVRDFGKGMKELRALSDQDGAFKVEGIASGGFVELTVSHADYGTYSDQKVPANSGDLEIVLKGLAAIRGTVVTPEGAAPESFVVQPQQSAPGLAVTKQLKAETYGTRDGSFEYRGLQPGSYTLQVRAPGYASTTIPDILLAEGEVKDLGAVELRPGGIVFGTVVDGASGAPVPGARVQIVQGSSRFVRPPGRASAVAAEGEGSAVQMTDARGDFSFTGLKGGPLTLRVSHKDYVTKEFTDVNPDVIERSQNLTLSLDVGGEILGTVLDSRGAPKADMPVYLIAGGGSNPSQNQSGKTDRNGRFSFAGVAPGTYTVKAHRFGVPGESPTEDGQTTLEMTNGGRFEVTLTVGAR
ncbi:MAG: carboxypeptidase regulatory-like domain-containing protein [Planctomycetota bacterium]